jgi:hypothetical protein
MAYAAISPVLSFDAKNGFVGGNFWDASWEASNEVSVYTSKFDAWKAERGALSADEEKG